MNPFLKYGAFILAAISFIDFFFALSVGDNGDWSIIGFEVNFITYLGIKFVAGLTLLAYGLGVGRVKNDKNNE